MDMVSIGKFIAALRKEQELTQEQLGEKLGVTNKTISRWETGTYLPPAEMLLSMSELFSVSINEILSGRRLSDDEYKQSAEENLRQTIEVSRFKVKERLDYFKKKWLREHIALMVMMGVIVIAVLAAGFVMKNGLVGFLAVLLAFVFRGYTHNAMMTYAEARTYDGGGQ